jgi:hypothetical protein
MPIHDWMRVDAGIFHDFHRGWTVALSHALNTGGLPPHYFAILQPTGNGPVPDVVTWKGRSRASDEPTSPPGVSAAEVPPRTRFVRSAEPDAYARRADRIAIAHRLGQVVAIIEIVSPGNKNNRNGLRSFVQKARELLDNGIHLLVIDLFPPSERDPQGIHKAIWDEFLEEPFELPADKPLTLAAYSAGPVKMAYVEPVAVGDLLPEMPIFLEPDRYVPAPLEATYQATWAGTPEPVKELLVSPAP